MANDFSNTQLVTDQITERLLNKLKKVAVVERDLEGEFSTAEYGDTINMRTPVYMSSTEGEVIGANDETDIIQGTVPVVVNERHKSVFSLTTKEMALDITSPRIQNVIEAASAAISSSVPGVRFASVSAGV